MSPDELIAFEKDIAEEFNAGRIRAPIHLAGGNEKPLIEIFKNFRDGDWVFCHWRSHYEALLAGVPPERVKAAIIVGKSMTLCWPEHRFFSSAIVAGCCPIALGVAREIKRRGAKEKVFLFIGDMTSQTGLAMECYRYSLAHNLPLVWVVADNNKSVCSDTREVLGTFWKENWQYYYKFELPYPHAGSGKRVNF